MMKDGKTLILVIPATAIMLIICALCFDLGRAYERKLIVIDRAEHPRVGYSQHEIFDSIIIMPEEDPIMENPESLPPEDRIEEEL